MNDSETKTKTCPTCGGETLNFDDSSNSVCTDCGAHWHLPAFARPGVRKLSWDELQKIAAENEARLKDEPSADDQS